MTPLYPRFRLIFRSHYRRVLGSSQVLSNPVGKSSAILPLPNMLLTTLSLPFLALAVPNIEEPYLAAREYLMPRAQCPKDTYPMDQQFNGEDITFCCEKGWIITTFVDKNGKARCADNDNNKKLPAYPVSLPWGSWYSSLLTKIRLSA